jgi:3D (Asp-Asp-Asp) domain-containing protein
VTAPPPPRPPRRRRLTPRRLAFQLAVGAIAVWAITHPRSPLATRTEELARRAAGDSLAAPLPDDRDAPTDSAPLVAPAAPAAAPLPLPGDSADARRPGAALAPPTAAPLGAGGRPYSPLGDPAGEPPPRERLGRPTLRRPPWLGGTDGTGRPLLRFPKLRTIKSRLFLSVEERARGGERVAVTITAYCLQGRTRRGNWVRDGIVAADPRLFPLGREIELWVGRRAVGRHLVDDTGSAIKGAKLDLWVEDCRDARRFGRRRGYAQLVPRGG